MTGIDILRLTLVVAHMIGLAAVIGPFLAQLRRGSGFAVTPMLGGSIVQLLTGGALVAARRADDLAVLGAKMGVKAGVAALVLVAAAAAVVWQRRLRSSGSGDGRVRPLLFIAGLAAIANVVIAVFWT